MVTYFHNLFVLLNDSSFSFKGWKKMGVDGSNSMILSPLCSTWYMTYVSVKYARYAPGIVLSSYLNRIDTSHTEDEQALNVKDFDTGSSELIFATCPPSQEEVVSLFSLITQSL